MTHWALPLRWRLLRHKRLWSRGAHEACAVRGVRRGTHTARVLRCRLQEGRSRHWARTAAEPSCARPPQPAHLKPRRGAWQRRRTDRRLSRRVTRGARGCAPRTTTQCPESLVYSVPPTLRPFRSLRRAAAPPYVSRIEAVVPRLVGSQPTGLLRPGPPYPGHLPSASHETLMCNARTYSQPTLGEYLSRLTHARQLTLLLQKYTTCPPWYHPFTPQHIVIITAHCHHHSTSSSQRKEWNLAAPLLSAHPWASALRSVWLG